MNTPTIRHVRIPLLMLLAAVAAVTLSSCATVRPYQRAYLNDSDMAIGTQSTERFSDHVHSYREGASGGGTDKGSGGCGCN